MEIQKLANMLTEHNIEYEIHVYNGGFIIHYPTWHNFDLSVAQHEFSYGGKQGLLEAYGDLTNGEAIGFLTAEEVFKMIYEFDTNGTI